MKTKRLHTTKKSQNIGLTFLVDVIGYNNKNTNKGKYYV